MGVLPLKIQCERDQFEFHGLVDVPKIFDFSRGEFVFFILEYDTSMS